MSFFFDFLRFSPIFLRFFAPSTNPSFSFHFTTDKKTARENIKSNHRHQSIKPIMESDKRRADENDEQQTPDKRTDGQTVRQTDEETDRQTDENDNNLTTDKDTEQDKDTDQDKDQDTDEDTDDYSETSPSQLIANNTLFPSDSSSLGTPSSAWTQDADGYQWRDQDTDQSGDQSRQWIQDWLDNWDQSGDQSRQWIQDWLDNCHASQLIAANTLFPSDSSTSLGTLSSDFSQDNDHHQWRDQQPEDWRAAANTKYEN